MATKKSMWVLFGISVISAWFFGSAIQAGAGDKQLYGTWRLVSYTRTVLATGETTKFFGNSPYGFINYGQDGRMLLLVVSDNRPKVPDLTEMTDQLRLELFKTMFAYGGTYTYNGKTVTHHVEISSDEQRTGTDQVREVKFEGNRVILSTPPYQWRGEQSFNRLTWERIEKSK